MFLSLCSHLLAAWFAFALPAYATYKALAHPAPDPDVLRTRAMYWAVLALFCALEQSLGALLAWLPFYWELRTLFLLYIALPHTQGSTYLYTTFLHPWCSAHESDIDAAIASAQSNALAFCRSRFDLLLASLTNALQPFPDSDPHKPVQPLAVPLAHLQRLWAAYAPSLLAPFVPPNSTGDGQPN